MSEVHIDIQDFVAVVTLDRPPVNATGLALRKEITATFDALGDRDDVRAIVLTGAGRSFCAGADVSATLTLQGQPEPVSFRVTGLHWASDGTTFTLRYHEASCSLPWLHAVLRHWSQRTQSTITLKEDLRLLPLKFKLPRSA